MLEEFEVEGLLGSGISREDSIQSLYRAPSLSQLARDSLECYPPPARSVDSLRGYGQKKSSNSLTREWSTATAETVLELPGGPRREHPSYGILSFSGSASQSSGDGEQEEMNWIDTSPLSTHVPSRFDAFRSDGSETDDDNASMEEVAVRLPLPAPLNEQDSMGAMSCSSSSSSITEGLCTPAESPTRKRIWEARPEEYVPRQEGAPAQSVASVLEIGMQWERARQASPRSKDAKRANGAIGRIRRIHGDAQYMN
jgi:hypothetical protein